MAKGDQMIIRQKVTADILEADPGVSHSKELEKWSDRQSNRP